MVIALPVAEIDKLIKIPERSRLTLGQIWKSILNRYFNTGSTGYVVDLMKAKNAGTLQVVQEIIHENKIPLSL